MNMFIPSIRQVRTYLEGLNHAQVQKLSEDSGVPFNTLWNIRKGTTTNPGTETVRKFFPVSKPSRKKQAV